MDQQNIPSTHAFMKKYRQGKRELQRSGQWTKPSDGMVKPRSFIRSYRWAMKAIYSGKKPKGKDIHELLDKADKWVERHG
jgi:hypothetical protein